jgi:dTDP-4-amino-4,6-dideoxygalactose transaminase
MRVPLIDLKSQNQEIKKEIASAISKIFDRQRFVLGEHGRHLELAIARKTGARFGVGVNSGSDALTLSLLACGVGVGDEVITTPFTFFATAGAISRVGAKPVFADIDPDTFNLDPKKVEPKITSRTKAIIPVHLFGLCCDMNPILSLAAKRKLFVIEDAAQAYGSSYHGKKAGSMGDAACLSFYPTKNLGGAGDGGMVLTSSEDIAKKIEVLRDHGAKEKYHHDWIGINSRLDEIQAAVLGIKLKRIDFWNRQRQKRAADYDQGFKELPVKTPFVPKGYEHTYHLYSIRTPRREALKDFLLKKGVGSGVYYPLPLHLQPCYKNLGGRPGDFPASEKAAGEILSLPMYPELTTAKTRYVISCVREFFGKKR